MTKNTPKLPKNTPLLPSSKERSCDDLVALFNSDFSSESSAKNDAEHLEAPQTDINVTTLTSVQAELKSVTANAPPRSSSSKIMKLVSKAQNSILQPGFESSSSISLVSSEAGERCVV